MPSQQYEPPNRDSSGTPDSESPASQDQSTREQPAQWAGAPERTPGTQAQPAYGGSSAAPADGAGPGWSQPADQSAQGYDPDRYDRNSSDQAPDDPNRYDSNAASATPPDSDAVRAREKDAFGGVKVGAAFFGWLTAVGATVVLIAIVAAVASALDVSTDVDGTTTSQDPSTLGLGKIIAGLGILFVAYYIGGYVAGRMARFNGARQGLAVWLWAVLIAAALTLIGILFDSNNDLAQDVSLPDFRIDIDTVTTETLIAVGIVLAVTLVGAIVGGLAGMRFHRRVDRAGFAPDPY